MSSVDTAFKPEDRQALLQIARQSIEAGLAGKRHEPEPADFSADLQREGASFVTLNKDGALRGCIGTLEAYRPLVMDVAANAYAAAFRDPRFPGLRPAEFELIEYHISVLTAPEPMQVESEQDLLAQLRPQVDGLVIEEGYRRGTFLPSVWEQLPDPREFLSHLKRKAGLPPNYWSDQIRISRYTSVIIS